METRHQLDEIGEVEMRDNEDTIAHVFRCRECGAVHVGFTLPGGEVAGTITMSTKAAGDIGTLLIKCTTPNA